jgi:hypothetical protein
LIDHGHKFSEIRHYTLAQVRLFSEAASRSYRRSLRDQVAGFRAASQYKSPEFKAYLKKLDG